MRRGGWLGLSIGLLLAAEGAAAAPRVLLLNSYHPQFAWTAALVQGVREELAPVLPPENLHIEYMDARRFIDDKEHGERLKQLLAYRYRQFRPGLVITSDDPALDFLLQHRQELLPGVPIVFCGVNVLKPERLAGHNGVTGIEEGMEIEGNLALIRRLQPEVERIVLLADRSSLGERMAAHARSVLADPAQRALTAGLRIEIWDRFAWPELLQRLRALPGRSAVLMLAIHRMTDGVYFSYAEHLPAISAASPAPVYGMWGSLVLGTGAVGGYTNEGRQHGRAAAALARRVLAGVPADAIPIQAKSEFRPRFDYRELIRHKLPLKALPADSILLYRPQSYYGRHRALLNSAAAVIAALLAVISLQLRANRRARRAERALSALNAELEQRVRERTDALEQQNAELERLGALMENLAHTDPLTGLPNRRGGGERLRRILARQRQQGGPLSLALLDVDHFKRINDVYGHGTGDAVLQGLAQRLGSHLRPQDLLCRWGGEEFLLLLPDMGADEAYAICERLRESLACADFEPVPRVTASFGLTSLGPGDSEAALLRRADAALYRAKELGRNRVEPEEFKPA